MLPLYRNIDKFGFYFLLLFAFSSSISPGCASIAIAAMTIVFFYKLACRDFALSADQKTIAKSMGILLGIFLITCFFSYNPLESLRRLSSYPGRFMLFFLPIAFVKTKRQCMLAFVTMLASILVADAFSVWQKLNGAPFTIGFDHNHIFFANQLMPMIIVGAVLSFSDRLSAGLRAFCGMTAGFSVVILLFNGSRGVWLALAIVLICFAVMYRKRNPRILPVIGLVFLLALGLLAFNPELKSRAMTITDTSFQNNTERVLMLRGAWELFQDHPVVGIGLDQFREFYNGEHLSFQPKEPGHASPHNNFALYLVETGILGLAAFCLFAYIILRVLYRKYRQTQASYVLIAFLSMLGFLLGGLTDQTVGMMNVVRIIMFLTGLGTLHFSEQTEADGKIYLTATRKE